MKNMKLAALCAAAAAAAILAGCGGGGGGGDTTAVAPTPAPAPAQAPAPAPTTSSTSSVTPVTAVAAPTYAAGSPQLLAFNEVNNARSTCGFGLLAQDTHLDTAASAHAAYQATAGVQSHAETAGQPGYTGDQVFNRAPAAGFTGVILGEAIGSVITPATDTAADAARGLLAAPYHAKGMLDYYREVGYGYSTIAGFPTLTVNLGVQNSEAPQQVTKVVTYPCAGITDGLPAEYGGEIPNPIPNAPAGTVWGQPIIVHGPTTLKVTSASITGPSGSLSVLAQYGDGLTTDPNGDYKNGWAVIIPAQMAPNTSYSVVVNYTVGGVPGTTSFTFSTGH